MQNEICEFTANDECNNTTERTGWQGVIQFCSSGAVSDKQAEIAAGWWEVLIDKSVCDYRQASLT